MSRNHQGYTQANQSLLEEDENRTAGDGEESEEDVEAGRRSPISPPPLAKSKYTGHQRKVSWDPGASEMNVLRPNIHKEDKTHEQDSSDDEVPQSFMIETSSQKHHSTSKGKGREESLSGGVRRHALQSSAGRKLPPAKLLGTLGQGPTVSIPPRPSEVDNGQPERSPRSNSAGFNDRLPQYTRQSNAMRGLDDYEKALWNWVNVYNLDAFLQEAYYYYDGKGIYSIALSRGLNLLLVPL